MRRRPIILAMALAALPAVVAAQQAAPPIIPARTMPQSQARAAMPIPQPSGGLAPMPVAPPGAQPAAPSNDQSTKTTDNDTVDYDSGPAQYIDKDHRWMMTGGVTFHQGDSTLETQSALVNLDTDMKAQDAKALAPVHLWNDDDDLTGTHGFIDFTTHVATIQDHITLIAKPSSKPQPKGSVRGQMKDPATITCDEIVYNYRKKTGHIPGPLTIHQKDRTVTADSADYDGNKKVVTLEGHVHGELKGGSEIDAPEVQVGIDEGHEWVYIPTRIKGQFNTKDNGDKSDDSGSSTPAPPPSLPPIPENPSPPPATSGPSSTPSTTK